MGEPATWKTLLSLPWIGTLVGLAGLIAALAMFLLGRRFARLAYATDELTVLGGTVPIVDDQDLEIRFRQRRVPRVTVARFVVWNAGKVTLRGSDIVEADPLRLEVAEPVEILHAEVLKATRAVNDFSVELLPGGKSLTMEFDFLDRLDGVVVQALHTGEIDDVVLRGTLRGMPSGPRYYGRTRLALRQTAIRRRALPNLEVIFFTAFVTGTVALIAANLEPRGALPRSAPWWLLGVSGVIPGFMLGGAVGSFLSRRLGRRFPASLNMD